MSITYLFFHYNFMSSFMDKKWHLISLRHSILHFRTGTTKSCISNMKNKECAISTVQPCYVVSGYVLWMYPHYYISRELTNMWINYLDFQSTLYLFVKVYTICPRSSYPFYIGSYYSKLKYKMGNYFLDI